MSRIVDEIGRRGLKNAGAKFSVGDTVDVHVRITEGDKERIQVFTGTVVARAGGSSTETFTVRRIVQGEGVERIFPLNSPRVEKIEVRKTGKARRAKLGYLRQRSGKGTRLAERRDVLVEGEGEAQAAPSADAPKPAAPGDGAAKA